MINTKNLHDRLLWYINKFYYTPDECNYLNISKIVANYDDSDEPSTYDIHISWGRFYDPTSDKSDLNEETETVLSVDCAFIDNEDVILGQFIQSLLS